MPATILVGAQWGDEGKGRVVDWLVSESDAVARYAGGDNAGHTVSVGGHTFRLHLVPAGIAHPGILCILGNGMVINPVRLVQELDDLASMGMDISPKRIRISSRAHIITPGHMELDGASEEALNKKAIGTTRRGISPAYSDKGARIGLLTGEMLDPERFADSVLQALERTNQILEMRYHRPPSDANTLAAQYGEAARRLIPYITDTTALVNDLLEAGKRLVCEGAQGTLLDIDHGHYPYVTSSSATVGGALTGLGFGPRYVDRVIGVAKAYSTRVGNGPFPTELLNETGEQMRQIGHEYGATTGRPRRCGWLDLVALRYATRVNGLTELVITKLDVLSGFDPLHIATAYELDGNCIHTMPLDTANAGRVKPVYETMPGWTENISDVRHLNGLPETARRYIQCIKDLTGTPISMISVGPERGQAILV
jgi:adenylosuccinate synthase